jgi:ABC-2 type transport system ATP-binding protein
MSSVEPREQGWVSVNRVSRSFRGRTIVREVALEAPAGSVVALVGGNGQGKTTLLRIVAGTLTADAGTVDVAGGPPGRGRSAFVPAGDRMLNWRLTGRQNLEFFAALGGLERAARPDRVEGVAAMLGVAGVMDQRIGDCSTGQRRRVMIACGFVGGAPVVLLDEPFEDLDPEAQTSVTEATRRWAAGGGCVLFATPDLGDGPPASRAYEVRDSTTLEVAR